MIADDSIKHRHIRTVYSVEYAQAVVEHCFVVFTSSVGDGFTWSICPWWRHQMETFSALLVPCAGNSPVTDEFPAQRAVTRSFDVFFDLRPNNRLSKQSRGWWFETTSRPLWRHCNAVFVFFICAEVPKYCLVPRLGSVHLRHSALVSYTRVYETVESQITKTL